MTTLIDLLIQEFECSREVTRQVVDHISGTYSIEREDIGKFLDNDLPKLEDYEHDLILSPLFTPKLPDQARFAELLGSTSVAKDQWSGLVDQLLARPTQATLVTSDQEPHKVLLRQVTLERFVHRLRLDGSIAAPALALIEDPLFATEKQLLKAIARRAIWENDDRRDILLHFLAASVRKGEYTPGDATDLLRLAEDYKPANVANLIERIPPWLEALRHEIDAGPASPFLSGGTQAAHGGVRDQRHTDTGKIAAKKREFAYLTRLQQVLLG